MRKLGLFFDDIGRRLRRLCLVSLLLVLTVGFSTGRGTLEGASVVLSRRTMLGFSLVIGRRSNLVPMTVVKLSRLVWAAWTRTTVVCIVVQRLPAVNFVPTPLNVRLVIFSAKTKR